MVLLEYLATYKRHVVETVLKLRVQSTDSYRSSSLCSWEGVWRLGGCVEAGRVCVGWEGV